MSQQEIPPWLREQLARLEQLQQNLQAVQMQKQQVEAELSETDRALEELKNTPEGEQIYKYAGSLLIKVRRKRSPRSSRRRRRSRTRGRSCSAKQETRFKESLKELQTKVDDMLKGRAQTASSSDRNASS